MKKSVLEFGAVGDGVHDDTAAFKAALGAVEELIIPYPKLYYKVTEKLFIKRSIKIKGEGVHPKIRSTSDLFEIEARHVVIENLDLKTNGHRIFIFDNSKVSVDYITIKNIISYLSGHAYTQTVPFGNKLTNITIKNCQHILHEGAGLTFSSAFAFIKLEDVTFDYVSSPYEGTAIYMTKNQGATFRDVNVLAAKGYGFYLEHNEAVHLVNCHADTCTGRGFDLRSNNYTKMMGCTSSLNYQHALFLMDNKNTIISDMYLQGRWGLGGMPDMNGVYVYTGNEHLMASNIIATDFTGEGIAVHSDSNINIRFNDTAIEGNHDNAGGGAK